MVLDDDTPVPPDCCLVRHRNERLWICGNGVVPQVASLAFSNLYDALRIYVDDGNVNG